MSLPLEERNAAIVAACRAGEKYLSVADRFGLSVPSVSRIAGGAGVRGRRGPRRSLPTDPEQLRIYTKLSNIVGAKAARKELGL